MLCKKIMVVAIVFLQALTTVSFAEETSASSFTGDLRSSQTGMPLGVGATDDLIAIRSTLNMGAPANVQEPALSILFTSRSAQIGILALVGVAFVTLCFFLAALAKGRTRTMSKVA
jgi:hypothetical protein